MNDPTLKDPRVIELVRLETELVDLDVRLAQYKLNHKAAKKQIELRRRELIDELRGMKRTEAQLYMVTDRPMTGEKKR